MEITLDGYTVLIDEEDYPFVMSRKWRVNKRKAKTGHYYFSASSLKSDGIDSKNVSLHRYIMGCVKGDGWDIDHINRNTLDNRKCNLRRATKAENSYNRSKNKKYTNEYKGVFDKGNGRFQTRIGYMGEDIHILRSGSALECAIAYDKIAIKLHGEFASTNFPRENYSEQDIEEAYTLLLEELNVNNTSGYRGVSYSKKKGRYETYISLDHKCYRLGFYDTPELAGRAYDIASIKLYGDLGFTNFPRESYTPEMVEEGFNKFRTRWERKNHSGYRGVYPSSNQWRAAIMIKGVPTTLGYYKVAEEAARAYDKKAIELLGDKAKLNFPEEYK